VEIWDAASGQKLQSFPAHGLSVGKLPFSRDGRWLITIGQDSNPMMVQGKPGVMVGRPRVSVWDTATWNEKFSATFVGTTGPDADISADGKFLVISKGSGETQLFDLEQKKPIATFVSSDDQFGSVNQPGWNVSGTRSQRRHPAVEARRLHQGSELNGSWSLCEGT